MPTEIIADRSAPKTRTISGLHALAHAIPLISMISALVEKEVISPKLITSTTIISGGSPIGRAGLPICKGGTKAIT